ncbi:MAG: hypothetical protein Q8Q47_08020 [Ignavibacteriaceae bacterium]|nr:hypothetical protein [Ignavibacteriaceae bacterium]
MGIQSMLTIGALMILSMTSLFFNKAILENSTVELENKVYLTAFSIADDMLEEIKLKAFDEKTVQFPVSDPNSLTPAISLGRENTDPTGIYNDIDDYKGFTKLISAPHAEDYYISCDVNYVSENALNTVSSSSTFYKKVSVTVSSPFMRLPVKLEFIFTLK